MKKDRRNVINKQVKKRGLCTLFHYMVVALILFVMIAADATPAFADYNVTISSAVNANGTWSGAAPDVWTPIAAGANVAVTDIQTRLNAGTSVVISTAGGGSENGDIQLNNSVSWNDNSTLTLAALRNVTVNSNITATGNTAGLTLTPNTGGGGGSYYLNNGAVITLSGTTPSLTIAGNAYTVINEANGGVTALQAMGLSGYWALGSDIDATATSTWNGGLGFAPIGNNTTPFTGQFDGLNHTITNLTINRPSQDWVGLFGYTGSGSAVRNVGLVGGSVNGYMHVGPLVGTNYGTISNTHATGSANGGDDYVGGLIGENDGPVSNSYATGSVHSGLHYVGGLIGSNGGASGTISNSYATGNVSGAGGAAGGLVGWSNNTIENSYATGNATCGWRAGGLVGENGGPVINSYATGHVSGTNSGGLVGYNFNGDLISNSYWDTTTSGTSTGIGMGTIAGATGLTTAQMQTMSSFSGWSIANTGGTSAIWRIYEGNTYPLLRSFLIPLTITADNVSKTYDGLPYTSALTNPIYSVAGASTSGLLFNTDNPYNSATDVGSYMPDIYSNQQGYDISYVNALLSITAADTTPDQFTFTDQTGVALDTLITSDAITVSGINTAADISITGGEYAINDGEYTSEEGLVSEGDSVTVQLMSSADYATTTEATLTIGGISDTFSVTTATLIHILQRDGAIWVSDTGWILDSPPFYPGTDYARKLRLRSDASYLILHKDGAVYDSAFGWHFDYPPYCYGCGYDSWARSLALKANETDYVILHQEGALWATDTGWLLTTPPYYPGIDYARALELRADDSYVILHKEGAIYDSSSSDWLLTMPPFYPGVTWAVDLKLVDGGYVLLHNEGAVWSSDSGWVLDTPPYYAGVDYARALELLESRYLILHKDGAIYDSVDGWNLTQPPYYPDTDYAVDLEVQVDLVVR